MARTAVGLFANSGSAAGVVRDLTVKGFLQKDIRVSREPVEMPGSGLIRAPHADFEVGLIRDLTAFGVVEGDAEAYVQGVRRGGVMVFATGTGKNADQAAEIMNCHGALEIEKISATRPGLPKAEIGEEIAEILRPKLAGCVPPGPVLACLLGSFFAKQGFRKTHPAWQRKVKES
jgi:hypothetical protein